jgi:hypothetical protein
MFADKNLIEWRNFYHQIFGITLDDVVVPAKHLGFDRLIVVAKGLTPQQVYNKCTELFKCWKYTDSTLDEVVTQNDRTSDRTYAIWVRNTVEADKEHKNKSANALKQANHNGITLLERLLLELKYYKEVRKHLDMETITLCAGSRDSDGSVPRVLWRSWRSDNERFYVLACSADGCRDDLRSREVVTA